MTNPLKRPRFEPVRIHAFTVEGDDTGSYQSVADARGDYPESPVAIYRLVCVLAPKQSTRPSKPGRK